MRFPMSTERDAERARRYGIRYYQDEEFRKLLDTAIEGCELQDLATRIVRDPEFRNTFLTEFRAAEQAALKEADRAAQARGEEPQEEADLVSVDHIRGLL
jgi:hypothetical protein